MATKLIDLIEDITQDDLPTNVFTIEDEDPMVILGKLNEVIAWLKELDIDNVEDILALIASKVAKTSQPNRVYATDNNGDQTTIEIGNNANQIPKYDADARLKTNTPSANDDVVNKKYVDDADALKQNALTETQLDAVNSSIDSTKVTQIGTNTLNITDLQNNKVDKTSTANQVYATDNNGNQTTIGYQSSQTDSANKIVQRDANGDVLVPSTPTSNNGATSKSYVDNSTVPSSMTTIASNSATTYSGWLWYMTIGKLVVVQIPYVSCKSGLNQTTQANGPVLFSGLPTPKLDEKEIIFFLNALDNYKHLRVKLFSDGSLRMHWSGYDANQSYSGTLVYVKQ